MENDEYDPIISLAYQLETSINTNLLISNELNDLKNKIQSGCLIYKHQLDQHPQIISMKNQIELYRRYVAKLDLTDDFNISCSLPVDAPPRPLNYNNLIQKKDKLVVIPTDITDKKLIDIIKLKYKFANHVHNKTNLICPNNSELSQLISDNDIHPIGLKDLNVKFKIIDIPKFNCDTLLEHIRKDNPKIQVINIEAIYPVNGNHQTYYNAIINVSITSSSYIEEYPFIYINNNKKRVSEYITFIQCNRCWSYNHAKKECTALQLCKKCSGEFCVGNNCENFCYQCYAIQKPADHMVGSFNCSTYKSNCTNIKNSVFQLRHSNRMRLKLK